MCLTFIGYQLDLFKRPLQLLIKSKEKAFTWFGVVLSMMLYCIICLSFFQSDMVRKTSPVVLEKTTIAASSPKLIFGENRPFMFGLVDSDGNGYIDDTIFKIDVAIVGGDNGIKNQRLIPSIPCEKISNSLFLNQTPIFTKYSCILDDNIDLYGQYSENVYQAMFFQLRICKNETANFTCKSADEIANFMAGMSLFTIYPDYTYDIDNYEKPYSAKFSTQTLDISFNSSIWLGESIKQSTFINDDFFLYSDPHQTILSISDSPTTDTFPIIQGQWTTYNNLGNPLSVIYFYSSNNMHYISRIYQKIQTALANCSGIASALFIIGKVLTELHSRVALLMIIIKNLYVFKTKTNNQVKGKKINERKKIDQEIVKYTSKSNQNEQYESKSSARNAGINFKKTLIDCNEDTLKKNESVKDNTNPRNSPKTTIHNAELPNHKEENNQKKQKEFLGDDFRGGKIKQKILNDLDNPEMEDIIIPISNSIKKGKEAKIKAENDKVNDFVDYLKKHTEPDKENYKMTISNLMIAKGKQFFGKQLTPKELLILKTEEVFNKEIDIVSILLKLQEIEKLKFVLLNPSQISLLKLLEKPVINYDEDNQNSMIQFSKTILESGNLSQRSRMTKNIVDVYKQIIRSENKSEVDTRILKLLEDEMKLYLEK